MVDDASSLISSPNLFRYPRALPRGNSEGLSTGASRCVGGPWRSPTSWGGAPAHARYFRVGYLSVIELNRGPFTSHDLRGPNPRAGLSVGRPSC